MHALTKWSKRASSISFLGRLNSKQTQIWTQYEEMKKKLNRTRKKNKEEITLQNRHLNQPSRPREVEVIRVCSIFYQPGRDGYLTCNFLNLIATFHFCIHCTNNVVYQSRNLKRVPSALA